jgi:hypothetical protein
VLETELGDGRKVTLTTGTTTKWPTAPNRIVHRQPVARASLSSIDVPDLIVRHPESWARIASSADEEETHHL